MKQATETRKGNDMKPQGLIGYDVNCSVCGNLVGYCGLNRAEAHAMQIRHEAASGSGHVTAKKPGWR